MTVRIALAGCGAVATRFHLPALRRAGAEVVAFASRTRASAEVAAGQWGSGSVHDDWRDLLDTDSDAVDICTPNALHCEMAIAAAQAGKHVLVEKPMAVSLGEADAMIAAARSAGVILACAHNARYAPPVVAARNEVRAGRIGTVSSFRISLGHAGPEHWAPGSGWFRDPALAGGGAMLDLGVHLADALRFVLDDDAVDVRGLTDRVPIEDLGIATVRFSNGAAGRVRASWRDAAPRFWFRLTGDRGTIDAASLPAPAVPDSVYAGFVRAVETGAPPPVTAQDGRAALAIVLAAIGKGRTRRSGL